MKTPEQLGCHSQRLCILQFKTAPCSKWWLFWVVFRSFLVWFWPLA